MAYTLSSGGSDWVNIRVLAVNQDTGDTTDLDDKLEYVKFSSLAWTHDHKVGCHHHAIAAGLLLSCIMLTGACQIQHEVAISLFYASALSRKGCLLLLLLTPCCCWSDIPNAP